MKGLLHRSGDAAEDRAATTASRPPDASRPHRASDLHPVSDLGDRVIVVHRVGALAVGGFLLVFGILGFTERLPFFSTEGGEVLGMGSNGLLALLSVVVGGLLIAVALRGERIASTVMIVLGVLFLLSALGNMAVLRTSFNVLAFEMDNVIFSIVVGLLLLVLGAYGRIGGHLPPESPYAHSTEEREPQPDDRPTTPEEVAAEHAIREAEIAVCNHTATPEQRRRVEAMAQGRTRLERRRVWLELDAQARAAAAREQAEVASPAHERHLHLPHPRRFLSRRAAHPSRR